MWAFVKLDERQLKIRGGIFKHGLMLMSALLLVNAFLTDFGVVWAEGMWEDMLILLFSFTVCAVEKVLRDILPISETRRMILMYLFAVMGFLMFALSVYGGLEVFEQGFLSETDAFLPISVFFLSIALAFAVRKARDRRKTNAD